MPNTEAKQQGPVIPKNAPWLGTWGFQRLVKKPETEKQLDAVGSDQNDGVSVPEDIEKALEDRQKIEHQI